MFYISSACLRHERIKDSVEELAKNGFVNIELSGGSKYYDGYIEDLLALKDKYGLNYLIHNYFPPPKEDFILNLASLDEDIYEKSLKHCERALQIAKKLGSDKYGFHAGFFINVDINQIGKTISFSKMNDRVEATNRFCEAFQHLQKEAGDIQIYIENHVLSKSNLKEFKGENPFMLTSFDDYVELKERIDFKLLLDVAHLRVSAKSLGLDFNKQLDNLMKESDYIHLSENDGEEDQSRCFSEDSELLSDLKIYTFDEKTITTETYGEIPQIKRSQSIVNEALDLKAKALECKQ